MKLRAKRNFGSRVPAVRKVAGSLHRRLFEVPDVSIPPNTKKMAARVWSRVRRACLKWARRLLTKRPAARVEVEVEALPLDADLVALMQRIAQMSTQLDWPKSEPADMDNEHYFYQRLQGDLERTKLQHMIGAHVSQLLYYVKKIKIEGVIATDGAGAVEALLLAYSNEDTDESSCRADEWAQVWHMRLRAFLGAAPDMNLDSPWQADPGTLVEQVMFEQLREEERQLRLAASAQRGRR